MILALFGLLGIEMKRDGLFYQAPISAELQEKHDTIDREANEKMVKNLKLLLPALAIGMLLIKG